MSADANVWRPPRAAAHVSATGRGAYARVSKALEGVDPGSDDRAVRYRRSRNGLDAAIGVKGSVLKRHLDYTIASIGALVIYVLLLVWVYQSTGAGLIAEIAATTEKETGTAVQVTWGQLNEALVMCAKYASFTMLALVALIILADRIRPTPWSMKLITFGWGASAAVFVSMYVNTWAAELMRIEGTVDPSAGARAAIYSAPFVEEAAKAVILFWLAMLLRRRIVTVHQSVVLAALSGIGFAAVENIVYYLRTYMYSVSIYQVDAEAELKNLVLLRGLATCFGHPLFTSMTALGLIVALTNRSKLVRVLAPVTGYLAAAMLHMLFNGFASTQESVIVMIVGGWIAVLALLIYLIVRWVIQLRTMRARLTELVQLGWLEPEDPRTFTRFFYRWKLARYGLTRGPNVFRHTLRLQRAMTELAYLREYEMRGCIDATGIERQRMLIEEIDESRAIGLDSVAGLKLIPPTWGRAIKRWATRLKQSIFPPRTPPTPPGPWEYLPPPQSAPVRLPARVG